jgi:major membrane immunogen (membrane-anchored lipoprotein)
MSEPKAPEKIEFKMLDYERVGSDTVTFKLEDGTIVKVKVDLDRAGIATNFRNQDGTSHYAVNTSVKVTIIPADKKFTLSKSQVSAQSSKPPSHMIT